MSTPSTQAPPEALPPELARRWLQFFCSPHLLEVIDGDLEEMFIDRLEADGLFRAQMHYWLDVILFLRPSVIRRSRRHTPFFGPIMWKNYLKIAVRSTRHHKGLSLINFTGLVVGMACCLVVLIFVRSELSYDAYHENGDDLYRLSIHAFQMSSGEDFPSATSPFLWAPALKQDYPELQDYARFLGLTSPTNLWTLSHGAREFEEEHILYADPSALELFSWPMRAGDSATALDEPESIVITEAMATKYFGGERALGETISIDPGLRDEDGALTGESFEYTVSGVLEDIPHRSHFTFDFLLPFSNLGPIYGGDVDTGAGLADWFWRGRVAHTYLLLEPNADPAVFEEKFAGFQEQYLGDATRSRGYYYEPFLQRVSNLYLEGNMGGQMQAAGDVNQLYLFALIALFVLAIASINSMNLATARSTERAREIGMRKALGARRAQILRQFLAESVVVSLVAFFLALAVARIALPVFYGYLDRPFVFDYAAEWTFLLSLLLVGVFVGLMSGSYPAAFISRFKPAVVLKGSLGTSFGGSRLRKALVVVQFSISAFLIMATLTVQSQLNFLRDFDLGFSQERVLVLSPSVSRAILPQYQSFRSELLADPQVSDVTASSGLPGLGGGGDIYVAEGKPAEEGILLGELFVDYNFVDMLELDLVAGRDFSRERVSDAGVRNQDGRLLEAAVIINEEAVIKFGWASPQEAIGGKIIRDPGAGDWTSTVIGVVKDFHYQSLRAPISPASMTLAPNYSTISVKFGPDEAEDVIGLLRGAVATFAPGVPFSYDFLDAQLNGQYADEQRLGDVYNYVASLAILIACLGLFGLAMLTAKQRTKEICVRKVLGASSGSLVQYLVKDFAKLVALAIVIAIPVLFIGMGSWLESFAHRVDIQWRVILFAGAISFAIAMGTVGWHAFRAVQVNPARALKV